MIISAALEGAQERAHLIENIKTLVTKRILLKTMLLEAVSPVSWLSLVAAVVTVTTAMSAGDVPTSSPASLNVAIAALEEDTLTRIGSENVATAFDHVYELLRNVDNAASAYQGDDPSIDQLRVATQSSNMGTVVSKSTLSSRTAQRASRSTLPAKGAFQSAMMTMPEDSVLDFVTGTSMPQMAMVGLDFGIGDIIPQPWPGMRSSSLSTESR